jgi:hypothetical protein
MAAQQVDEAAMVRKIDGAVASRMESIAGYTVTEHYVVYRGGDETHASAEMTVETTYSKETGKSYKIVSESGSELIQKYVLHSILETERTINLPGNREKSWLTSANYEMHLKSGAMERLDGRDSVAMAITPRQSAPNLVKGTLWVDARDGSIVKIDGVGSASASVFTGPTKMMRQYAMIGGFAMATHARAESDSFLLGKTVVTIDYEDYKIQMVAAR